MAVLLASSLVFSRGLGALKRGQRSVFPAMVALTFALGAREWGQVLQCHTASAAFWRTAC
jgi:hypothetical protein